MTMDTEPKAKNVYRYPESRITDHLFFNYILSRCIISFFHIRSFGCRIELGSRRIFYRVYINPIHTHVWKRLSYNDFIKKN